MLSESPRIFIPLSNGPLYAGLWFLLTSKFVWARLADMCSLLYITESLFKLELAGPGPGLVPSEGELAAAVDSCKKLLSTPPPPSAGTKSFEPELASLIFVAPSFLTAITDRVLRIKTTKTSVMYDQMHS